MQENTNEELQLRIRDLEKEVARLHAQIKKQHYGLVWLDVPEGFESETENKIPILEEVKDKAIKNDDGKPTHILIEGDNYHALTCLNYTHKGKIDVIYIDPPYNTGSDGFTYKDKRILKEFPDGTPVPKDHPMRHSYWLSFMSKRLELAKNLLSDKGVIFISIDDNEQANLKLLCDKVFDEKNCLAQLIWEKKYTVANDAKNYSCVHDFVLCYAKDINSYQIGELSRTEEMNSAYKNPDNHPKGPWKSTPLHARSGSDSNANFSFVFKNGVVFTPPKGRFSAYSTETLRRLDEGNEIWFGANGKSSPSRKTFLSELKRTGIVPRTIIPFEIGGHGHEADEELKNIMTSKVFLSPKPTKLLKHLFTIANNNPTSTILDFFAGSGTTMHAVMKLNEEDGGKRQCILVQQKENEQNICESVTYERNRRVIQGYTNSKNEKVEGLGNSLKYYKTGFVGKNNSKNATDSDKVELSLKAGYLLALAENTLEEVSRNDYYQIFEDGNGRITAVYFKGSMMRFGQFVGEIENYLSQKKTNKANVYIFCWGDVSIYENEFEDMSRISLKAIPKPILDIYKSINC